MNEVSSVKASGQNSQLRTSIFEQTNDGYATKEPTGATKDSSGTKLIDTPKEFAEMTDAINDTDTSSQFALPTSPLSIGGILDAGITLFRNSFKFVFPVAAITSIPYALLNMFMSSQMAGIDPEVDPELAMAAALQVFIYMPFLYFLLVLITSCVIHRQIAIVRGQEQSLMADLTTGFKLIIPLTLLMILYIVFISIGSILLIIPGLIVAISMSLFLWVPQMEERSAWGSLWRSHSLVWGGNWWRTLWVVSVVSIIGMVLSMLAYFGIGALAATETYGEVNVTRLVIEALLGWLTMALILPLTVAVMQTLYNDLLLRNEGSDIEARLADLDSPEAD